MVASFLPKQGVVRSSLGWGTFAAVFWCIDRAVRTELPRFFRERYYKDIGLTSHDDDNVSDVHGNVRGDSMEEMHRMQEECTKYVNQLRSRLHRVQHSQEDSVVLVKVLSRDSSLFLGNIYLAQPPLSLVLSKDLARAICSCTPWAQSPYQLTPNKHLIELEHSYQQSNESFSIYDRPWYHACLSLKASTDFSSTNPSLASLSGSWKLTNAAKQTKIFRIDEMDKLLEFMVLHELAHVERGDLQQLSNVRQSTFLVGSILSMLPNYGMQRGLGRTMRRSVVLALLSVLFNPFYAQHVEKAADMHAVKHYGGDPKKAIEYFQLRRAILSFMSPLYQRDVDDPFVVHLMDPFHPTLHARIKYMTRFL